MIKQCEICREPGATYPSIGTPGGFLCYDAVACLDRFARNGGYLALYAQEKEEDFESD